MSYKHAFTYVKGYIHHAQHKAERYVVLNLQNIQSVIIIGFHTLFCVPLFHTKTFE